MRPFLFMILFTTAGALTQAQQLHFTVSMPHPQTHLFQVELRGEGFPGSVTAFRIPVWTPGYYQRLDYAKNIGHLQGTGNREINHSPDSSVWYIHHDATAPFTIRYEVKATRNFVATPFLDSTHGYIVGAGIFIYPDSMLQVPITVTIQPFRDWQQVVTGLDRVNDATGFTYLAPNFDVLYDCPMLVGNLDTLPAFYVNHIPHYFAGYQLGNFDTAPFIDDLQQMVRYASSLMGDIPYRHYTFIGIGPGMGGIEHANSTTVSFSSEGLSNPGGRVRMLQFLTHEYFHHYNVKRIRPVELGPFDYEQGNRTNLLWVSEGLTVYYEYLILKRAGLINTTDVFNGLQANMKAYESQPGRLYQSLAQASYNTWSDGPFGNSGEEAGKTISYYDKGPVIGMLFDFAIRHHTHNQRSLDDVMRRLYRDYYQEKQRGFTEAELKTVIQQIAGDPLNELFDYIYTTREPDYNKYLGYAGLSVSLPAPGADRTLPEYFIIRPLPHPTALQQQLLESWLGE